MTWHFWLIPVVIVWSIGFGRRWKHLPRGRERKRHRRGEELPAGNPELAGELENQRNYIAELESRVAELENRLDFTERLLTSRADPATTA